MAVTARGSLETGILLHEALEAARQQRRADQQHHGQADLGHHQRAARSRAAPPPSPPRPDSFSGRCMSPRAISIAGHDAERDRGQQRQRDAQTQAFARRGRSPASRGSSTGVVATSAFTDHDSHGDAERGAHQRQQHALGEELADQAAAARADRRANGDLALAHGRARQQQARHVGAGDDQQERRRAEQREERRPEDADDFGRERNRARGVVAVGRRVLLARGASSARAARRSRPSTLTPGFSRTSDSMKCAPRLCCATSHVMRCQTSVPFGYWKPCRHHADDGEQTDR